MKMTAITAGALALTVVLPGCNKAADKQQAADARATASGFVPPAVTSRLDFGGAMERRFRRLDRNGDDRLTPDEWPRRDSRLQELDRNQDGVVSAIEFSEGTLKRFDRMDVNRDGTVTSEEEQRQRTRPADGNTASPPTEPGDTVANMVAQSNDSAPAR